MSKRQSVQVLKQRSRTIDYRVIVPKIWRTITGSLPPSNAGQSVSLSVVRSPVNRATIASSFCLWAAPKPPVTGSKELLSSSVAASAV